MKRPFSKASIAELEQAFAARGHDADVVKLLSQELAHRETARARKLAQAVARAGAAMRAAAGAATSAPPVDAPGPATASSRPRPAARHIPPYPPVANGPADILTAWTALEVLSPAEFARPEDLAGQRSAVALLDQPLPWQRGEKSQPMRRLFYQVVLGALDWPKALEAVTNVFADSRAERPRSKPYAALAVLTLDKEGRPIDEETAVVASVAWGLPVALTGGLEALSDWERMEPILNRRLAERVRILSADGKAKPLDRAAVEAAFDWLVDELGLPHDLVKRPWFAIRKYVHISEKRPPDGLILNSFALPDLIDARGLARGGQLPALLRRYLAVDPPGQRRDLLNDHSALAQAAAPGRTSPARWPGAGRHPLVLLQQAAVNLAQQEGKDPAGAGLLAVNGPPGTGKTTLLRDLIAGLVTDRAKAMMAYESPADAFTETPLTIKSGSSEVRLHRLDERLRGFEMLVASSNNGAVENVSREIPALAAVAQDAPELRYFKTVADNVFQRDSWGLAAAVLGNSGNRYAFQQAFWDHPDKGLAAYLAAAAGFPASADPNGKPSIPAVVAMEAPPAGPREAQQRWEAARATFSEVLARSEAALATLERLRRAAALLPRLSDALTAWDARCAERPAWWRRLPWSRRFRQWRAAYLTARSELRAALDPGEGVLDETTRQALRTALEGPWSAEARTAAGQRLSSARAQVDGERAALGPRFVDQAYFDRAPDAVQRSTPWLDNEVQRLRDDVFIAALALHRAFIDAAARPLLHNLNAILRVLWKGPFGDTPKDALLPDLWSSLFLVVPVVSTTFASVPRMLAALPPRALGWLLVDEAGQARPQEAVGALLRVRHAIVVGDPVQIEPVVTLPASLTAAVHRRFGVDPDRFDAPGASVQTLADAASAYMAEFFSKAGSRTVGAPLLVHRRCDEPMFSIANAVAYAGLMVQAKPPGDRPIVQALGPSRWIDVRGGGADKWSPEEGDAVLRLLERLRDAGFPPNLYVISPFRVVADRLQDLIWRSGVVQGQVADVRAWLRQRVGTVHTAQGREDKAVILVLGAPLPSQAGARTWAGRTPNLLNVAVTRAQEALYVVGSHENWRTAGVFEVLANRLPVTDA